MTVSLPPIEANAVESVRIRPASDADRPQLLAMYETFEPRPASLGLPPRQRIEEWLDRLARAPGFLAFAAGRLAGHAILFPDGRTAEVAVFVHQDYRNRGVGRQLLEGLVAEARRAGMRRIWGMTDLDNVPMLRLARTVGFVQEKDPCMFRIDLESPPKQQVK